MENNSTDCRIHHCGYLHHNQTKSSQRKIQFFLLLSNYCKPSSYFPWFIIVCRKKTFRAAIYFRKLARSPRHKTFGSRERKYCDICEINRTMNVFILKGVKKALFIIPLNELWWKVMAGNQLKSRKFSLQSIVNCWETWNYFLHQLKSVAIIA